MYYLGQTVIVVLGYINHNKKYDKRWLFTSYGEYKLFIWSMVISPVTWLASALPLYVSKCRELVLTDRSSFRSLFLQIADQEVKVAYK